MEKKKKLFVGLVAIAVTVKLGAALMWSRVTTRFTVESVAVSASSIYLRLLPHNSAAKFRGYETEYRDEALYVRVRCGLLSLPFQRSDGFDFSIPNQYETIRAIYLWQDGTPAGDALIWSQDQ